MTVKIKEAAIFIKFGSHRQRRDGLIFLADKQSYYSFSRSFGKGVYKVTAEEYEKLKTARVLFTRLKAPYDDLIRCH